MFNRKCLLMVFCAALAAGAVSLLSSTVILAKANSSWGMPHRSQNFLPWKRDDNKFSRFGIGRLRILDRLTMRRGNYGGNGQQRKLKARPSKRSIGGVEVTVTNILIALNIAAFLAIKKFPNLCSKFMKFDRAIARGQTYRLFTSVFVHEAIYHVGANSYSLYQIGPMADKVFGSARFLSTYLFAGIMANIATYVLKTSPASLGASGCTFGIIGAFSTHFYRNRAVFGKEQSDAALGNIKRTVLINLLYGFSMPNIDNGAHIGGFLSGALFAYLFGPRLSIIKKPSGRRAVVDRPLVPYTKYWKMVTTSTANTVASTNILDINRMIQAEEINYAEEVFNEDSDFNSDSTGMRGGGGGATKYI